MALNQKRFNFTLIELISVIAIMLLVLGISVSVMRKRSGLMQFENSIMAFRQFCSAVRAQTVGSGQDRIIYYQPEERTFLAGAPLEPEVDRDAVILLEAPDELPEDDEIETPTNFAPLKWLLPQDFAMHTDTFDLDNADDQRIELFRFFPDGSASGLRELKFQFRDWCRIITISPLTGRIMVEEGVTP